MPALTVGAPAPDFTLDTDTGEKLTLSSLKGRNVVLFFYPKADTPGCTTEACELRDQSASIGATLLGISPDTVKAQAKFKTKYGLPYTLLADPEHTVAEAYGVWAEKSMYGKKYMGIERTTFLIGADGKLAKVFSKVKPKGHGEEVRAAVAAL